MVGQLGTSYLAASEVANKFFSVFIVFLGGMSHALVSPVAASVAKLQYKKACYLFKHSLLINIAVGTICYVAMVKFLPILYQANQNPMVIDLARPYFMIIATAILPRSIFTTLKRYLEATANTRIVFYISCLGCIINVMLNYLFIYGKLGIPAMGLVGAGWATLIAHILMMMIAAVYVFMRPHMQPYVTYFNLYSYTKAYFLKLLRLGVPIAIHFSLEVGSTAIFVLMMGWISSQAQAAHAVVSSIIFLEHVIIWAWSVTASILVGQKFGKGNRTELARVGWIGIALGGIISLIIALIWISMRSSILLLYHLEQDVFKMASELIFFAALFNFFDSLYTVAIGVLRGLGDTAMPVILIIISNWLIVLPLSYLLAFGLHGGPFGVWSGIIIGRIVATVGCCLRFYLKSRALIQQEIALSCP